VTRLGQIVVCVLVAAAAYGAIRWIHATEPTAQRVGAVKETAMLVEVVAAESGDFVPQIVVVGTVEPEREVHLRPRVSGTAIERGPNFVPGGFVAKGETLLQLDPTDYETAKRARQGEFDQANAQHDEALAEARRIAAELQQVRAERNQAQAELAQANADLQVEEGRRLVARRDYELLGEKLDDQQRRLALREPQLAAARAKIEAVRTKIAAAEARILATQARIAAAEAAIEASKARMDVAQAAIDQARNDFERTTIIAPFEAHVLRRMADEGSEVSTSVEIAQLVGVEEYWIVASVPISKLRWIRFPTENEEGSQVFVHHDAAWGKGRRREGRVKSLIGTLDRTTRLARVVVAVKDPLARKPDPRHPDRPALIVGSLVEVRIQAEALRQVTRIDRAHLRKNDTVWVMKDGKLDIRKVQVAFEDPDHVYLRSGLEAGERVVHTNLATVKAGAALRTEGVRADRTTGADRP
jgi:RND family efflux transporter MFP subunit